MKPNSRVVVATDFSVGAAEALREGARLAAQAKGPLGVVHVLPRLAPNAIRERLRRIDAREDSEIFIDEDPDYEQIVRRAAQWHAELIVVGSRSASPLGHMFRGVGERVVRDAHYPVLVARPGHGHGGVLAATDLTKPSLPAVVAGAEEADRRGTRLRVVHAVGFLDMEARYLLSQGSANDGGEYDFAGLEDKLEDAVGRLGIDPTCVILDGPAPPRDRQQRQGDRCRARRGRCAREERRCTCHPAWRRGGCGSERAVLGPAPGAGLVVADASTIAAPDAATVDIATCAGCQLSPIPAWTFEGGDASCSEPLGQITVPACTVVPGLGATSLTYVDAVGLRKASETATVTLLAQIAAEAPRYRKACDGKACVRANEGATEITPASCAAQSAPAATRAAASPARRVASSRADARTTRRPASTRASTTPESRARPRPEAAATSDVSASAARRSPPRRAR